MTQWAALAASKCSQCFKAHRHKGLCEQSPPNACSFILVIYEKHSKERPWTGRCTAGCIITHLGLTKCFLPNHISVLLIRFRLCLPCTLYRPTVYQCYSDGLGLYPLLSIRLAHVFSIMASPTA